MSDLTACTLCRADLQPPHYAHPRECAFKDGQFSPNNWNCGVLHVIRGAMYYADQHEGWLYRNDMIGSYGVLIVAVPSTDPTVPDDYDLSGLLVANWYKDRGRTDDLTWAYFNQGEPGPLTREQAVRIAAWLQERARQEERPGV